MVHLEMLFTPSPSCIDKYQEPISLSDRSEKDMKLIKKYLELQEELGRYFCGNDMLPWWEFIEMIPGDRERARFYKLYDKLVDLGVFKRGEAVAVKQREIYLDVKYHEKDYAKSHGAKWDPFVKKWFVLDQVPEGLKDYHHHHNPVEIGEDITNITRWKLVEDGFYWVIDHGEWSKIKTN